MKNISKIVYIFCDECKELLKNNVKKHSIINNGVFFYTNDDKLISFQFPLVVNF